MRYYTMLFCVMALAACSGAAGKTGSGSGSRPGAGGAGIPNASSSGAAAQSGGSAGNSVASAASASCSSRGATRSCCGSGTQTCGGTIEFLVWGPCLDNHGATLTCGDPCGAGEFGPGCDAGVDSGSKCSPGAFGPGCDASVPPPPKLCMDEDINNEPEILGGYAPATGESVGKNGQIKLWVTDEHACFIAPNEQVDSATGMVTSPGDRTAKASDGYLFEPALYIAPETAENGGTPHFPQLIKGWYNNNPMAGKRAAGIQGAPIDPPPAGTTLSEKYDGEDVWDVSSLGLSPGTYIAEFVIHDGDEDRAVGCVTIVITP